MVRIRRILERLLSLFRLESWLRLLALCILVGVAAGLAGVAFDCGLRFISEHVFLRLLNTARPGELLDLVLLIAVPAAGLFLAGLLAWRWEPEVIGGGVDAIIRAFHRGQGRMRARVAALKSVCTILTIGFGGSAGKEGPSAQIGAGLGSGLGGLLGLSVRDRRLLMLAGCAAGLGAVLRAPLGGALFAAEMLYREPDFEHDAVIPGVISSVTAYSVFTAILGFEPVLRFQIAGVPVTPQFPTQGGHIFGELLHYALLSLLCALVAYLWVKTLRFVRTRVFGALRVWFPLKPLLGGLALGAITAVACLLLMMEPGAIMSDGKSYVQEVIGAVLAPELTPPGRAVQLTARALVLVILLKTLTTALTVGSGASGGLLFPTLFIGALTGALYAKVWMTVPAGVQPQALLLTPEARAGVIMVAMGGLFAGCTKTPIASLVMVSEMTGSYGLAVPLMLCGASSYLLTRSFTMEEEQVPGMVDSPAHRGDFLVNVLEDIPVSAAIAGHPPPDLIRAGTPLPQVWDHIKQSSASTFLVVDEHDRLIGLFSLSDVRQVMNERPVGGLIVAGDLGTTDVVTVMPETSLSEALSLFTARDLDVLPVVEPPTKTEGRLRRTTVRVQSPRGPVGSRRVIGMLTKQDLIAAYRRRLLEAQAVEAQEASGGSVFEEGQQSFEAPAPPPSSELPVAPPEREPSGASSADEELIQEPAEHVPPAEPLPADAELPTTPASPTDTTAGGRRAPSPRRKPSAEEDDTD